MTDLAPLSVLVVAGCSGGAVGVGLGVVELLCAERVKVAGKMVNMLPPLLSVEFGSGDAVGLGIGKLSDEGVEGNKGMMAGGVSEGDVSGNWGAAV